MKINWIGLGVGAALVIVWQLLVTLDLISIAYLPAPSEIFASVPSVIRSGELGEALWHTLGVCLLGWLIGSGVGWLVGLAAGRSRRVWKWVAAPIEFFRAIPGITLLPLAILLFGFSVAMELVLTIYGSMWMVTVATMRALQETPHGLLDSARTLQLPAWRQTVFIMIPASLPVVFVSLRLALSLSLVLAVAAEMLGNPRGLGAAIGFAQEEYRPAEAFLFLFIIGLLGVVLNIVLVRIQRLLAANMVRSTDNTARV